MNLTNAIKQELGSLIEFETQRARQKRIEGEDIIADAASDDPARVLGAFNAVQEIVDYSKDATWTCLKLSAVGAAAGAVGWYSFAFFVTYLAKATALIGLYPVMPQIVMFAVPTVVSGLVAAVGSALAITKGFACIKGLGEIDAAEAVQRKVEAAAREPKAGPPSNNSGPSPQSQVAPQQSPVEPRFNSAPAVLPEQRASAGQRMHRLTRTSRFSPG